jgi:hypothetical protein
MRDETIVNNNLETKIALSMLPGLREAKVKVNLKRSGDQ